MLMANEHSPGPMHVAGDTVALREGPWRGVRPGALNGSQRPGVMSQDVTPGLSSGRPGGEANRLGMHTVRCPEGPTHRGWMGTMRRGPMRMQLHCAFLTW